jgi:TM2 domain-containing membrane protein YozV
MDKNKPSMGIAIAGLIVNLCFPGVGSLIAGKTKEGVLQLIFYIVAFICDITLIGLLVGIPLGIAMWVWALVTGIRLIEDAK